jgi:hypothetical protein
MEPTNEKALEVFLKRIVFVENVTNILKGKFINIVMK